MRLCCLYLEIALKLAFNLIEEIFEIENIYKTEKELRRSTYKRMQEENKFIATNGICKINWNTERKRNLYRQMMCKEHKERCTNMYSTFHVN